MSRNEGKKSEDGNVIDFGTARASKLDEKRRRTERVFFKNTLGVYSLVENDMRPIEILDVSEEGCSFQVPFDKNSPWPKDIQELPIRLYFSRDTYLPVLLEVVNSRAYLENGVRYIRYGCRVDPAMTTYPAYKQFVRFLKLFGEHAHRDAGRETKFYA